MIEPEESATVREQRLAMRYAPLRAREGVAALLALDRTLARLTRTTRDPILAQVRLAWWREALGALGDRSPGPDPLLATLRRAVVSAGVAGADLAVLVDGWEALLGEDAVAERHAHDRGAQLFTLAARLLGAEDDAVGPAGEGWALAELALASRDPVLSRRARALSEERLAVALARRWSLRGRALGALAHCARLDLAGVPPGSPRRVGRMLLHRLTGR